MTGAASMTGRDTLPAPLRLRRARAADAADLLRWRNEPTARMMFKDSGEVEWDSHCRWLARALADPDRMLLIGETPDGRPVGICRLETDRMAHQVVVSISVDAAARGRGHGTALLAQAIEELEHGGWRGPIIAEVKQTNSASLRLFKACGFVACSTEGDFVRLRRDTVASGAEGAAASSHRVCPA